MIKLEFRKEAEIKFQEIGEAYQILISTNLDIQDKKQTQTNDLRYGHELSEEGFPLVADIAYAKEILGVEPNASKEEVEKVYVKLSLEYHPDIGEDHLKDEEYFKLLTEAYKTFMNQEIITDGQVRYVDVLSELDWGVAARGNIHKVRMHGNEDTMFGFSPKEMKKGVIWEKIKSYAVKGVRHSLNKGAGYRGGVHREEGENTKNKSEK